MPSSSDGQLTLGVIGSGFAARTLVAAATASSCVRDVLIAGGSGVVDLCRRYGADSRATVGDLLGAVDAVAVATPHADHAWLVGKAIEAGVHVFCEKPFVTDSADGARLIRAAADRGLTLSVNHFQRYRTPHQAVADLLEDGGLRLYGGQARLLEHAGPESWKAETRNRGFMLGYGIHAVDLLHAWVHTDCVEVTARSLWIHEVERATAAVLRFAGGQEFSIFASDLVASADPRVQPGRAQLAFELLTPAGILQVDSYGATVLYRGESAEELGRLDTWDDFDSPVRLSAYQSALDQFVSACLTGEEPVLTATAALHAVQVCEAIHESALREGKRVCV